MPDIERLLKDKVKFEKELESWSAQQQLAQTNVLRLKGALSYINLLIKEAQTPPSEPPPSKTTKR